MKQTLLYLKRSKHNLYNQIKTMFLFHSNKIEGSTFNEEQIQKLIQSKIVSGDHDLDDVIETQNSIQLFDFIVDTASEDLTLFSLKEYHSLLKQGTIDDRFGFKGKFKSIPNILLDVDIELAKPHEVEPKLLELLEKYNTVKMDTAMIADFHKVFEQIHPFNDGNGRIGRFLMLKQCIKNDVDFILIDERNERSYKDALYKAQKTGSNDDLIKIFEQGQELFREKASLYYEIEENYQDEINSSEHVSSETIKL